MVTSLPFIDVLTVGAVSANADIGARNENTMIAASERASNFFIIFA
jgi:hypothetical protein